MICPSDGDEVVRYLRVRIAAHRLAQAAPVRLETGRFAPTGVRSAWRLPSAVGVVTVVWYEDGDTFTLAIPADGGRA